MASSGQLRTSEPQGELRFNPEVDFCPGCGALLPSLEARGDVVCIVCKHIVSSTLYDEKVVQYTVKFNRVEGAKLAKEQEGEEGPVVERRCPKCDSERMSYAAIQLRSADEGQTVFFTCVKCKFKESENS